MAAWRLHRAGHRVTVFEALDEPGGRAHVEHFGPGHWLDTGAGWLTSNYRRTLALLDELGERERLRPLRATPPPELLVRGRRYSGAGRPRAADGSTLVPPDQADRVTSWLRSLASYPNDLSFETTIDHESAHEHLARLSPAAEEYVFAPMFEGLFAPLEEQSAEFVRSWVAAGRAAYYQVDGGMDAPFRSLAERLPALRTGTPVERIERRGEGVAVTWAGGAARFDAAVVALPAPIAAQVVAPELCPPWLTQVRFSGQCRLYAARPAAGAEPLHLRPLPMGLVASVEVNRGSKGAWGRCPPDWEWALVCANGAYTHELLHLADDQLAARLWGEAERIAPGLFPLESAAVRHVIRWEHAVPVMAPGHFRHLAAYERRPPVVFAGDWAQQACIEGAVRSGEAAAAAFDDRAAAHA